MGYRSLQFVPRITSYAQLLTRFNETKPIRGLSPERRPLARRQDHNSFWMRMTSTRAIECMVYRTAVATFLPDEAGTIEVRNGDYATQTTHGFILRLLGIEASRYAPFHTALRIGQQDVMLLGGKGPHGPTAVVKLCRGDAGLVFADEVTPQYQYAMNRKAANNVRRKYKEFTDYFGGMLKLRTQRVSVELGWGSHKHMYEHDSITVPFEEVEQVLGYDDDGRRIALHKVGLPVGPTASRWRSLDDLRTRKQQEELMLRLIDPDQDEATKTDNYYKAALALMIGDRAITNVSPQLFEKNIHVPPSVFGAFKTALMMAHAQEVLTLTKLPKGKLPSRTYNGWLPKINEEEGV